MTEENKVGEPARLESWISADQERARNILLQALRVQRETQSAAGKRDWKRDELYDPPSETKLPKFSE